MNNLIQGDVRILQVDTAVRCVLGYERPLEDLVKRVRVDFNNDPLYTTDRGGKLKIGEKVIAYTTDDEIPFGFEAMVTEIQPSQKPNVWIDVYYLDCDYEGHRYEGTELGLNS